MHKNKCGDKKQQFFSIKYVYAPAWLWDKLIQLTIQKH